MDPGRQHQIVVSPGDVQWIELERPQPGHDRPNGIGRRGECAGRRQEVATHEKASCGRAVDRVDGHGRMVRAGGIVTCAQPSGRSHGRARKGFGGRLVTHT